MSRRTDDCDIDCFKRQQAYREAADGQIVDEAMRDLLSGNLDSQAVHEVMSRRVGTINDYVKAKDWYEAAVKVRLHTGTS